MSILDNITKQLRQVYDPEISVNVLDLGLIYDIQINEEEQSVEITHTLTSAFCPFSDEIVNNIKEAGYVEGIKDVSVITTLAFILESNNIPRVPPLVSNKEPIGMSFRYLYPGAGFVLNPSFSARLTNVDIFIWYSKFMRLEP